MKFIKDYDACRHFGSPKHPIVSKLTIEKCRQHLDLTVKIWDKTVKKYMADRKDSNNELREFESVLDIINDSL
jgi:hypothetical protein